MQRVELNVVTQEQRVIQLTDAEITAASVSKAQEDVLQKEAVLVQARELREKIINRLSGIAARAQRGGRLAEAEACDAATLSLLDVTTLPAVVAATNGAEAKAAVMSAWLDIATTLKATSTYAATAFKGLDI